MVSCPKATYETVQPILKNFGKLFYTGDKPGTGADRKARQQSDGGSSAW
jgi:3-hydroxyisobutyrate dehydrogenase-like beta-hydroxyacid dehydrogenase